MNAGTIDAVLTLNATAFKNGLNDSLGAVEKFKASFSKSITPLAGDLTKLESSLRLLSGTLDTASGLVNRFSVNAKNLSQFSTYANSVNRLANALKILSSDTINAEQGLNVINNMFKYFRDTLNGTEIKISGLIGEFTQLANSERSVASATRTSVEAQLQAVNSLNNNRNAVMSLITGENQLAVAEKQESVASEQSSVAHDKASASMEKQTASTNRLGKAMSSLRIMGTMVASMLVYNFAHNLITATRETVNAKSEMEGYFQMLGFTTSQVGDFNKALDETVAKFPRLNKYALGETISSIGVEFELTTEEMKKAMPVVSMITSEYLRAGRNVNEASLAVKDILQGEFQRLSRETGVKSDQLIEAGWSGDKKDVMGLLEALDKVGKSRNWDIFVTKANSLNDAVLILQNRFGEWSADMVNRVQPTILGVFNDLMVVATSFSKVLNGALNWLGGDGIGQSIVKWGGLATAIGGVIVAFTHYRTGANLTQIAQMGLTKSIGASILGLEAETVAEYGLRNSIVSTVTGIKAETLANEEGIITRRARLTAITASITGLEMEAVAQLGLTKSLLASIFNLDMATVKEYGFLASLGSATTGIEIQEFALKSHHAQLLLTIGSLSALAGALLLVSGYLAVQVMKINDNIDKYNRFRNIIEHGDETIQEYKDTVDSLTTKKQELSEKLETLTENSSEYKSVADELVTVNNDLATATDNYEDSVNAVAWSKHKQELYDTSKAQAQLESQKDINNALIEYGINVKEANEMASPIWTDAIDGWNQQYELLQKVNLQYSKNATTVKYYLDELKNQDIDPKEVQVIIKPLIKSGNKIAEAKEKLGQSTGMMEYLDAWLWLQYWQIQHSIDEFWVNIKIDWSKAFFGIFKGFGEGLGSLQLPFDSLVFWLGDQLKDLLNFDGLELETLPNLPSIIGELLGIEQLDWNQVNQQITDALIEFNKIDLGQIFSDFISSLFENTDGSGEESTGSSVSKSINIADILRNIVDFSTEGLSQLGWEVASNFGNAVVTGILGIPASLGISDLLNAILNIDVDALGQWVDENIITPLKDAVTLGILNTPVLSGVSDFLGLGEEPQAEAETEGMEIGTSFNTGIQTGLAPVDGIINSAFEGLNLDDITANFTTNTQTMTTNASTTAQSVSGSYTTMKDNQRSALDSMVSHNTTQFEAMKVKSNASLSQMRDSTSNVTSQMTTAWSMMKDSIIASAEKIKTDSSNRFSTLSDRIGGFYRKIQNPSLWGSAGGGRSSHARRPSVGRTVAHALKPNGYGGGLATRSASSTMTVSRLKNELCPDGNCGNIFDGYDSNDVVNVWEFLQSIGEGHGLGGWNFASNHNQYIKTKSDEWKTAPPIIQLLSGIATNTSFKVGEFNEATPKISFSTFQDIATAIFSQIPYRLYFDSSWKGSWLGALQAGACNCYDGALALMALAQTFGFSASMGHGTWTNPDGKQTAHVWAIINGIKMDTTGMQQRGSWNPSASAGGSPTSSGSDKTVNITIDMQGATIYGVEDLDNRIEQGVRRGLREEFNDSYSVII